MHFNRFQGVGRPSPAPHVLAAATGLLEQPTGSRTGSSPPPLPAERRGDVLTLEPTRRRERVFDCLIVLLVLPVVLIVGVLVALAIKLDSPGPVFFRSTRVGVGGREFGMLKFRKMGMTAEGGPLTFADDDRFTPIGQFLALTKLDELPQVWNVLRGQMRLVGPRPEVPEFVEEFHTHYRDILVVLPGITGPAAVAYANESKLFAGHEDPLAFYASTILPDKLGIDLDYVAHRSLLQDVLLLAATAATPLARVLRRRGRSAHSHLRLHVGWVSTAVALVAVFLATNVPF